MNFFPLFRNFKSTSFFKAFMLNALATGAIATVAFEMRHRLNHEKNITYKMTSKIFKLFTNEKLNERDKMFITFVVAFIGALVVYHSMYIMFHFGGGQMISHRKRYSIV